MIAVGARARLDGRRRGGRRRRRRRSARRCASRRCRRPCATSSHRRYEELARDGRRAPPVAVRSSALGEDSEDASHAGQQESFLWVRGVEQVCDAVRDCWVSLYTPQRDQLPRGARRREARAGDGRDRPADGRRRGLGRDVHLQPRQRRPEHGRAQRELGARDRGRRRRDDAGRLPGQQGHGRGRAPDGEREGRRVRARTPPAAARCGSRCRPERRDEPCLGEAQLAALVEVAQRVERHFGSPPGHRVGDRARAAAAGRAARAPGASGDDAAGSGAEALRLGDVARDGHVRRRREPRSES